MKNTPRRATALAAALVSTFAAAAAHADAAPHASWPGGIPIAQPRGHFRHFGSRLRASGGGNEPWHRAQDVLVRSGSAAWVEARFGYGLGDNRLGDEDIDVYLRRADTGRWESIGTTRSANHSHPVVRANGSQSDEAGLVAFRIPDGEHLPLGLNSVRFIVRGDRTVADATVAVVGTGAKVVVTDVDGTLTEFEHAFGRSVFGLSHTPAPHPGAAALLRSLAHEGYTIAYVTARPDYFSQATRQWLQANGFPAGMVRTREGSSFGVGGPDGVTYKSAVLRSFASVLGHPVDIGFGNTITDVRSYEAGNIPVDHRFFYRYVGDARGGVRHDDYRVLAQSRFAHNQG